MNNLKIPSILFIFSLLMFSCTKEDFESTRQVDISEIEKQQIYESSEFIELQSLNSILLGTVTQKLLSNPKLVTEMIELNYTDSEIIEKLAIKDELFEQNQQIVDLTKSMVSAHPVLNSLNRSEQKLLINELLQNQEKDIFRPIPFAFESLSGGNDPCQQQFENDMQYIHGQYDSAIMGAAIAIVSGAATSNPIPIAIGGTISVIGVGRAIYAIAVAIDDYNECVKENENVANEQL